MTKSKKTRRALLASIISMMLCAIMLIGSTFAWFTDSDTTAISNIVSGTLDIEIVDANGNEKTTPLTFVNVDGSSEILWEPGATFRTEGFQLKNVGNLWLKYKIKINNTEVSYNKLNEVIDFSLVNANGEVISLDTMKDIPLEPKTTSGSLMYLQGTMDPNAGNDYQDLELNGVAITVYATQYTSEKDMIDDQYDKDAAYQEDLTVVANAKEFVQAFSKLTDGEVIVLNADIEMKDVAWTPVRNTSFVLDGNGFAINDLNGTLVATTAAKEYTIKNVTFNGFTAATNSDAGLACAGLISYADTCAYIMMENVTINNANIQSDNYAGGFVAYTSGYGNDSNGPVNASHNFKNCTLTNSTITGVGSTGGLIGHAGANSATTTRIEGFTALNNTITSQEGTHKDGTIIGTANVGVVYIDNADITSDIGRFVPGDTGKLYINGVEQSAFAN